ncbi:MAG: hypothetical protein U0525_01315 [Patescibacteria group bacterium]
MLDWLFGGGLRTTAARQSGIKASELAAVVVLSPMGQHNEMVFVELTCDEEYRAHLINAVRSLHGASAIEHYHWPKHYKGIITDRRELRKSIENARKYGLSQSDGYVLLVDLRQE